MKNIKYYNETCWVPSNVLLDHTFITLYNVGYINYIYIYMVNTLIVYLKFTSYICPSINKSTQKSKNGKINIVFVLEISKIISIYFLLHLYIYHNVNVNILYFFEMYL